MTKRNFAAACAITALLLPAAAAAQDASRGVSDGGIKVAGWAGRIDAKEAADGQKLTGAKLAASGKDGIHVTTGPAVTYWKPTFTASGNYTVKATFTEPKYMALNSHPHPYGIMIAGSNLDTDKASFLYCAAYGNGSFIMRGFGPAPFQLNGRRGEPHAAIKKAAAAGEPVTQEIAVSVKGDKVECAVNGQTVGTYDKAAVTGEGKLKSTDGIYGIRFGHNTEAVVTGLTMTKDK